MNYPLSVYSRHDGKKVKREYEVLVTTLKRELNLRTHYLDIRSLIEDFSRLANDVLSLRNLREYFAEIYGKIFLYHCTFSRDDYFDRRSVKE
jgi:hypothetical protein